MSSNTVCPNSEEDVVRIDLRYESFEKEEPWAPLEKILWTTSNLGAGQVLEVITPFEPLLLTRVLAAQGFPHETGRGPEGEWQLTVRKRTDAPADAGQDASAEAVEPPIIELDLRGVKKYPSLAMLVEAMFRLPDNTELIVHTDQPPAREDLPENCSCVTIQSVETREEGFSMLVRLRDAGKE